VVTEVVIPMLGVTIKTGRIVEWLKGEGEPIEKGESIFVVETDKVTTEVEAPASGILAKILLPTGEKVPVLTIVGIITEPGEEIPEKYLRAGAVATAAAPASVTPEPAVERGGSSVDSKIDGLLKIVPAARKLANEMGLDIEALTGTGPDGSIVCRDVEDALAVHLGDRAKVSTLADRLGEKEGIPLDAIRGKGVDSRIMTANVSETIEEAQRHQLGKIIPMDSMRQAIARRMSESAFTAPHVHFFTDINMDQLLICRQEILADFEAKFGKRPSVNDFLIKAVSLNIRDFPILNATIRDEAIHILPEVNVCLAVALPNGLVAPALSNTDQAGLADIVRQRVDLVQRARSGNLTIEELERGTFTISSLAQYDVSHFTAIINPPQSAILSVGKTRDELCLKDGAVQGRKVATFGLSVDHRIIDGAVAAAFLQSLNSKLEKPILTFLKL